jgi:hypothetical protein
LWDGHEDQDEPIGKQFPATKTYARKMRATRYHDDLANVGSARKPVTESLDLSQGAEAAQLNSLDLHNLWRKIHKEVAARRINGFRQAKQVDWLRQRQLSKAADFITPNAEQQSGRPTLSIYLQPAKLAVLLPCMDKDQVCFGVGRPGRSAPIARI